MRTWGPGRLGSRTLEEEGVVAGGGVASGDEVFAALAYREAEKEREDGEWKEACRSAHGYSSLTYK